MLKNKCTEAPARFSEVTDLLSVVFRQGGGGAAEPDGARRPASRLHPNGDELHRPEHPPPPPAPSTGARQHAGRHHRPSSERSDDGKQIIFYRYLRTNVTFFKILFICFPLRRLESATTLSVSIVFNSNKF